MRADTSAPSIVASPTITRAPTPEITTFPATAPFDRKTTHEVIRAGHLAQPSQLVLREPCCGFVDQGGGFHDAVLVGAVDDDAGADVRAAVDRGRGHEHATARVHVVEDGARCVVAGA